MKKIFFIALCVYLLQPINLMAKPKMKLEATVELQSKHEGEYKLVLFDLYPLISNSCFVEGLKVFNGTKNKISIIWNDAKINYSKLCFRDDTPQNINAPKPNENVYPMMGSTRRDIFPYGNISRYDNSLRMLYNPRELKKKEEATSVDIMIPIMFSDEKIEIYKLTVTYQYVLE